MASLTQPIITLWKKNVKHVIVGLGFKEYHIIVDPCLFAFHMFMSKDRALQSHYYFVIFGRRMNHL